MAPRTELSFRIAGIGLSVEAPDLPFTRELARAFAPFASDEAGSVRINVSIRGDAPRTQTERQLPELTPRDDGRLFVRGDTFEATLSRDRAHAELLQPPERFPLETVLKLLLAEQLAREGGLLL